MPPLQHAPVVFCAPTIQGARRAAWNFAQKHGPKLPLDPPLVLGSPRAFEAWRLLASQNARSALVLPRLATPELFFARAHGANARALSFGGVPRLWALSNVLRRLEGGFSHLDFDADDTQSLRAMASLIADMRRQNLAALPVGDDPFGRELDRWRADYDVHLEEIGAFDFEAAPALFAQSVQKNRAFAFPRTLLLDDLFDLSPCLSLGLSALINRADVVCATLALPGGWNDEVAARAREFWTSRGARFEMVEDDAPRVRVAGSLLGVGTEAGDFPPDVSLWRAHTPHDEWQRIAAHIRARLDKGDCARDFCLVLPDAGSQSPLARAAFEAHGVPLDLAARDTDASPLVERLLRLLVSRLAWNVDALHDLFGDGTLELQWTTENGELKRFDAGRLRRAHRSIRGESDEAAWHDAPALSRDWEMRISRLRDSASGRGDEARAELLARSLVGSDLEGVARFKRLIAPLENPLSARDWANTSLSIFDALCPVPHGDENEDSDIARRAQRSVQSVREALEAVAARAGEDGDIRSSNRWAAWLRLELATIGEEEDAPREAVRCLRATQAGEAGSWGEREIFVAGLSERAWPARRPQSPWPITTSTALDALYQNEPAPLAKALHGLARLLATDARLHLSHPAWIEGSESESSPLVEDMRALFPGALWPELPRVSTYERATSRGEWLQRLGETPDFETPITGVSTSEINCDGELSIRLRALNAMRRGRTDTKSFGRYDGVLGECGRELLIPLLPREEEKMQLSASGAENYARCGLRFFFERVLELGDEERAEDDLSRAESGDLVHRILHAFRREWSEPLSLDCFERARKALEIHTRRECERLGLPPILRRAEARRLLGTTERDGALVRLLRAECSEADSDQIHTFAQTFHPLVHLQSGRIEAQAQHDFQLEVGGNGLEQAFRLPFENVVIKGRIDRLDSSPDGAQLLVLDYKTGSASSLPALQKGSDRLHFQLAVYVLAARHLTGAWQPAPRIATSYLSPRKGFAGVLAEPELLSLAHQKSAMNEATQVRWLADARLQIERIGRLIESGTFNLSLRSAKVARCEWCAHAAICGQNPSIQVARAQTQLDSNVVFFPDAIEWNAPEN